MLKLANPLGYLLNVGFLDLVSPSNSCVNIPLDILCCDNLNAFLTINPFVIDMLDTMDESINLFFLLTINPFCH